MGATTIRPPAWVRPAASWITPGDHEQATRRLQREFELERLPAAILAHRGLIEPEAVRNFLFPDIASLHDPFAMRDMEQAAERLLQAIEKREPILLYGDYDVDGTSSIVVLKKAIEVLGGHADFHVPHRLKEGYGIRVDVIERAAANGVRLVVSVDTGIRANEAVRQANALGIDVIVTDHHLPESELPPALAVLNPNRPDCQYPNKSLCGAGVTFKLVQALLQKSGVPEARRRALLDSFLKPVAIATVADIVPLIGENRVIVQRGLSGLRQVRNAGLKALLKVAGLTEGESPTAYQVAFRLAPRINAAGRMATARDVIELFLTDDAGRALELAEQLDVLNRERQQVESDIIDTILEQCAAEPFDASTSALVFAAPGWHLGVLGIVASRLVERFCRPVFVLSEATAGGNGTEAHLSGSGRSIPAFHLLEALESMPDLFTRFGGHRQAAGLTMAAEHLESFRQDLAAFAAARLCEDDMRPRYMVDADTSFAELSELCVQQVLGLGPFGFGNPAPILRAENVVVAGHPKVLKEGKHFSIPIRQDGRTLFCKAWNFGDRAEMFTPGERLDILFQIEDDAYSRSRGYGSWCAVLKDVRKASEPGEEPRG